VYIIIKNHCSLIIFTFTFLLVMKISIIVFLSDDGSGTFHRNGDNHVQDYAASQLERPQSILFPHNFHPQIWGSCLRRNPVQVRTSLLRNDKNSKRKKFRENECDHSKFVSKNHCCKPVFRNRCAATRFQVCREFL
jgi:hypothetical protein